MKIKQRASKKLANTPRFEALIILDQVLNNQKYSNDMVNDFVKESKMDQRDQNLTVKIVYGVIQNKRRLEFYLSPLIKDRRVEPWVNVLLLLSVYQLLDLDRVPAHAVINEAVEIAKLNGHKGLGNFVNAVLRNFQRSKKPSLDSLEENERLGVKYSLSTWIVDLLSNLLPKERLEEELASLNEEPYLSARINPAITSLEEVQEELNNAGISTKQSPISKYGLRTYDRALLSSDTFKEGKLIIQDDSSQLVAPLGNLNSTDIVLDACSAPGGKATHIASYLDKGHLTALDLSENKLKKVKENATRLGLDDRMTLICTDASKFNPTSGEKYDKIYVDAPCSGLGLMRKKPEIKYNKKPSDIKSLQEIQLAILKNAASLLKDNGTIIYSTCTITKEENEDVIEKFLEEVDGYYHDAIKEDEVKKTDILTKDGNIRIWPSQYHSDGFFIARLKKA